MIHLLRDVSWNCLWSLSTLRLQVDFVSTLPLDFYPLDMPDQLLPFPSSLASYLYKGGCLCASQSVEMLVTNAHSWAPSQACWMRLTGGEAQKCTLSAASWVFYSSPTPTLFLAVLQAHRPLLQCLMCCSDCPVNSSFHICYFYLHKFHFVLYRSSISLFTMYTFFCRCPTL